jgi:hypothetical protein
MPIETASCLYKRPDASMQLPCGVVSLVVVELAASVVVQTKTGATVAPVFGGTDSLPLLAALLLPAFSSLLRHCVLSPPSCGIRQRRAITVSHQRCVHTPLFFDPTGVAPRTPLHAHSLAASPARSVRVARALSRARWVRVFAYSAAQKKSGEQSLTLSPPRPVGGG